MRLFAIFLLLCSTAFAYPDKGRELRRFISLQSRVFEIAKEYQPDPFEPHTSNLKKEIQRRMDDLKLENLPSAQLYRLGVACFLASYPQEAGDQSWDLVFDDVCWRCVRIIASRPGLDNAGYLAGMKALFGSDGSSSLRFKKDIESQAKLKSK